MSETNLETLVEKISTIFSADSAIGGPIVQDDKVIIPVMKMGFALGAGSGKGSSKENEGEGTGAGGGAGIEPLALIVIYKDAEGPEGVEVLPLKSPSKIPEVLERAIEAVAEKIEKIKPLEEVTEEKEEEK
ncbi:sporulation protein [Candidatus Bathyarchaeota archaeon]|nr:sporulation protein [Candidatus Bathyarchaeota archaeon]